MEVEDLRLRGILTFLLPDWGNELTFLYTAHAEDRPLPECDEGILQWIPVSEIRNLPLWEGDRYFLPLLQTREDCFSLKLVYAPGGTLLRVISDRNLTGAAVAGEPGGTLDFSATER